MGKSGGCFTLDSRKQCRFPAGWSWGLRRSDAHLGCLLSISAALGFIGETAEQARGLSLGS